MDGSVTIFLPEMKETYHSKFGAIQEAKHVFIKNGLDLFNNQPVSILEIGFGTGLNSFITYLESVKNNQEIYYTGIEAYPVAVSEALQLNYVNELGAGDEKHIFELLHTSDWGKEIQLNANFMLLKQQQRFEEITEAGQYDLIYFDAFGYHAQPELWGESIFAQMYKALKNEGVLVTYACRTVIKRAMEAAGFSTQKVAGPPGKREMLIAKKGLKYC